MPNFKKSFKWISWRFFPLPGELSIKSIIETILYVAIFAICWYLFISWNSVPVRENSIYVDCLSEPSSENSDEDIAPIANINFCIPMTTTDWEQNNHFFNISESSYPQNDSSQTKLSFYSSSEKIHPGVNVSFSQWKTSRRLIDSLNVIIIDNNKDIEHILEIRKAETSKSEFWQYLFENIDGYPYNWKANFLREISLDEIRNQDPYISKIFNYRNRIFNEAESHQLWVDRGRLKEDIKNNGLYDKAKKKSFLPVYYVSIERTSLPGSRYHSYEQSKEDSLSFYFAKCNKLPNNNIWNEAFIAFSNKDVDSVNAYLHPQKKHTFSDSDISKPGWFRLEDISQAYYDVKIQSVAIDSINLKFDFIGATEFSMIQPPPDKITMSSIEYTDPLKILEIRANGLKFHAKFIELENRQEIRVFVLTAIMSAQVMIFISMIFFGIIKLFAHLCKKL